MEIDLAKYVGKWYEIARIPNDFEPNMKNVTAHYEMKEDGTIKIVNSGYINGIHRQIIGTAKQTEKDDTLCVSFFPCECSDYIILAIDKYYNHALVGGNKSDFLWVLSRNLHISKSILNQFIKIEKGKGYNVEKIKFS